MNRVLGLIMMVGAVLALAGMTWALPAPTNVVATDGTSNTYVTVTWNAVPGAAGYRILMAYEDDPTHAFLAGNAPAGQNFQWIFMNNIAGTPFYFWVVTTNASGQVNSPYSNSDWGWASGTPQAPVSNSAYMYNNQVVIDWNPPSGGIWFYRVNRCEGIVLTCNTFLKRVTGIGVNGSTYTYDPTAIPGHTYTYSVKTIAANYVPSVLSNVATITV